MKSKTQSILFVCLGNICRSPAADAIMRTKAAAAGLDVEVDSAGIGAWHAGQLPDIRMRRCGDRHGYDIRHRARQVEEGDFDRFDIVMGMDAQNVSDLLRLARTDGQRAKVRLMADYLTRHPGQKSIPDPYYGDDGDFELAVELIEDAADNIVKLMKEGNL